MKNLPFFRSIKKIYFIGIGGISLSGLALILHNEGFIVAGSDVNLNENIKKLEGMGIEFFCSHKKKNIKKFSPDLVVFSSAIGEDNPERIFANENNILCLPRADFIGEILKCYKNVISIAGSHGKTTTTAMIGEIFMDAGLNPTVHIGGESVNLQTNSFFGSHEFFITEACEYKRSFLKFKSSLGVILNVEEDHPDCYENLSEIEGSFIEFSKNCDKVIVNSDFFEKRKLKNEKFITFNLKNANFSIKNIRKNKNFGYNFSVLKNGENYGRFCLNIFGKHNILNALCAICVCDYYKIDKKIMKSSLENFRGVKRRFEKVENTKLLGDVFFDYAHHPTEIKNLLFEVKKFNRPIVVVFQPHTYSRTKKYFNDFLNSFNFAFEIIFLKTYSAREKVIKNATSFDLYKSLKEEKNVKFFSSFKKVVKYLKKTTKSNFVTIFIGAGDIYNIKDMLKWNFV